MVAWLLPAVFEHAFIHIQPPVGIFYFIDQRLIVDLAAKAVTDGGIQGKTDITEKGAEITPVFRLRYSYVDPVCCIPGVGHFSIPVEIDLPAGAGVDAEG